jgi:hypothetical protein
MVHLKRRCDLALSYQLKSPPAPRAVKQGPAAHHIEYASPVAQLGVDIDVEALEGSGAYHLEANIIGASRTHPRAAPRLEEAWSAIEGIAWVGGDACPRPTAGTVERLAPEAIVASHNGTDVRAVRTSAGDFFSVLCVLYLAWT